MLLPLSDLEATLSESDFSFLPESPLDALDLEAPDLLSVLAASDLWLSLLRVSDLASDFAESALRLSLLCSDLAASCLEELALFFLSDLSSLEAD